MGKFDVMMLFVVDITFCSGIYEEPLFAVSWSPTYQGRLVHAFINLIIFFFSQLKDILYSSEAKPEISPN